MAQPLNTWAEFKKLIRQLKAPEAKERFETIIVDTADIAYDACEKYVLSNNNVDKVGDIPYGQGYNLIAKEFDEALRQIIQMDYGLVLISHSQEKTFTDEKGIEYTKIVPTLGNKPRNIVSRLCDIIGYSRPIENPETGATDTYLFMRGTTRYLAGSRFKYTSDYISFTYDNLVKDINDAIDKQAEEEGRELFTDKASNLYQPVLELNFDELMGKFNKSIEEMMSKVSDEEFANNYAPRINQIVEKYLGKGKKVANCNRDQVEALSLIVDEIEDLKSL